MTAVLAQFFEQLMVQEAAARKVNSADILVHVTADADLAGNTSLFASLRLIAGHLRWGQ